MIATPDFYKLQQGESCRVKLIGGFVKQERVDPPEIDGMKLRKRIYYHVPILDLDDGQEKILRIPQSLSMSIMGLMLDVEDPPASWWKKILAWFRIVKLETAKIPEDFVIEKYTEDFRGFELPRYRVRVYEPQPTP